MVSLICFGLVAPYRRGRARQWKRTSWIGKLNLVMTHNYTCKRFTLHESWTWQWQINNTIVRSVTNVPLTVGDREYEKARVTVKECDSHHTRFSHTMIWPLARMTCAEVESQMERTTFSAQVEFHAFLLSKRSSKPPRSGPLRVQHDQRLYEYSHHHMHIEKLISSLGWFYQAIYILRQVIFIMVSSLDPICRCTAEESSNVLRAFGT